MTSGLAVGQTIELTDGRKATIRFVGQTHFAPGDWVGVELEDESGKNDGSVQGERYFDCPMGRGMFVRPQTCTVIQSAPPSRPVSTRGGRRPSSAVVTGTRRPSSALDPALGRRISLNAPSPSPGPRPGRPHSMGVSRSPSKPGSPTKQLGHPPSTTSSRTPSRTGTPSNAAHGRVSSGPTRARGGTTASTRGSMGPPALPASRMSRQPSTSSSTGPPTRGVGSRVSRGGVSRAAGGRVLSGESSAGSSGNRSLASPSKSDEEQGPSPVRSRTKALERSLTGHALSSHPSTVRKTPASTSARTPASSSSRSGANNAISRENEDLKAKLKVLERKRLEDREKLKDVERLTEQKEKYANINKKIEEKFQTAAKENSTLRQQLKEAEKRLESVEELQAEHDSVLELATLDREMAEETAEVLKDELDALKQKQEELELEVEVLREENAEYEKGVTPEDRMNTNWIQMQRQNDRLKEALIRLRDLSQEADEENKHQIKALQEDLQEYDAIKEQYEIAKEKLLQTETQVDDLREQLDNALGAEDIIEKLSEEKMNLQEELMELRAAVDDLEALKEINDELEVNHVQNEKEMQEEIDFKEAIITEQVRLMGQQEEKMEDQEYTLSRFRELVTNLQTDLEDMRASHAVNEAEAEQLNSKSRAMMDLNLKLQISAAKTQVKTIDLELERMNAQEAQQHLSIVKLFLPDAYNADKNSVLALLRFKRLAFKANLLQGFVKERANGQPRPGAEDDIFAGCDTIDKLTWVASMCDRFVNAISHCSVEDFAKYEGALFELEPVERALNGWIEGLKHEELKEKQCAEELSRSMALMTHLGSVHISESLESFADHVQMQTICMQSHLESAATTFGVVKDMVQRVVPPAGEDDELAQHFASKTDAVISQTRSVKVVVGKALQALEDLKSRSLALSPETGEVFEQCENATRELADMSRKIGVDLHVLTSVEGREEPLKYTDIQDSIHQTAMNAFSSSETDLYSTYLSKLRVLSTQITDLAAVCTDLAQTQEFERSPEPWELRAAELKAQKTIPVDAEEELRQLKEHYNQARREIAVRDETISTANLKNETLEARMKEAHAKIERMDALEKDILDAQASIAKLNEDREKQDRELKTLETDRDKWQKIASDSQAFGEVAGAKAGQERAVATAREMEALKDDITSLQAAVRYLREDSRRARVTEQQSHDWLAEPLKRSVPVSEQRRQMVITEGKDVLSELLKMATSAKVYNLKTLPEDRMAWRPAKVTPHYHAAKQAEDFATWRSWQDAVVQKARVVMGAQTGRRPGAAERRRAAARLRIRLWDEEGKVVPGQGEVQIVGSREWEALQGRVV